MERILYLGETFCAVSENGRLTEYIPVRAEDRTGMILTGRVDRMMPGLEAAFVDLGGRRDGFLPLRENSRTFTDPPVKSGDRTLVQIRKEETGNKGAFLTRDLSIPGSYLILMPKNRHIGVSARVKDPDLREEMLRAGRALAGDACGLVMRENAAELMRSDSDGEAAGSGMETLRAELESLKAKWREIQTGNGATFSPEEELKRDYEPRGITRTERVDRLPADLERQRREAEGRTVRLPHGGSLVIDRCEALTVIDVNSASDAGGESRRETALRTNLEACRETMIQARLRNLSGILILDLIDMEEARDRERVRDALEEAFREDRVKTVIHGYTSLGLMEMTRKRSRSTWQEKQSM